MRKAKLASQVADVSVCGAIAPYNHLLGGKLIALLMGSEDVRRIYKKRYDDQVSEIASQLAGRPISRSTDLLVLTTTSLYGIGDRQYDGIKIPQNYIDGIKHRCKWKRLKLTEGFRVTHLSDETVVLMRKLCRQTHGVRRVNSVFGEGSSPRVRLIREALLILGIHDGSIMKHGLSRMVYAYEYYPGARDRLTGFASNKDKPKIPSARNLSKAWIKKWVIKRVQKEKTINALKEIGSDVVSLGLKNRVADYVHRHKGTEPMEPVKLKKKAASK